MFSSDERLSEVAKGVWIRPSDINRVEVREFAASAKVVVRLTNGDEIEIVRTTKSAAHNRAKRIAQEVNGAIEDNERRRDDALNPNRRRWGQAYASGSLPQVEPDEWTAQERGPRGQF